jgi:hypothetical protein
MRDQQVRVMRVDKQQQHEALARNRLRTC